MRRARRNPLFSPTEEVVVTVLGVGALIGIAYYISVKNQPSGNVGQPAASNAPTTTGTGTGAPGLGKGGGGHGGGGHGGGSHGGEGGHPRGGRSNIRRYGTSRWGWDGRNWYVWDGSGWTCPPGYTLDVWGNCVPLYP